MDTDTAPDPFSRRLRYYGPSDYATYWQIEQAAEVIRFDPASPPEDVNSILELHNARLFIEAGFFPLISVKTTERPSSQAPHTLDGQSRSGLTP